MNKLTRIILYSLAVTFIIGLTGCTSDVEEILAETNIEGINLNDVEDGEYKGEHKAGLVEVVLDVEVQGNRITNLNILKHNNWRGGSAEVIVDKVLKEQTLEVDVVSGATVSSKVILKAIENALNKGVK